MLDVDIRGGELHFDASVTIRFMRTLRIPDDGRECPLPAGLGEPVKNAGHPAASAADGETVPDEKHPVLGLAHSWQQQSKGGQQDQIVYSRYEHDELQWG